MKLKTYNTTQFRGKKSYPAISLTWKTGLITLNKAAAILLGITGSDTPYKLLLLQDEDRPQDWYLKISDDEKAFVIRRNRDMHCFNSTQLARVILNSVNTLKTTQFKIATQQTEGGIFAILTNSAIK